MSDAIISLIPQLCLGARAGEPSWTLTIAAVTLIAPRRRKKILYIFFFSKEKNPPSFLLFVFITHPARLPSTPRWSLVSLCPGLGGAVQRATRTRESVPEAEVDLPGYGRGETSDPEQEGEETKRVPRKSPTHTQHTQTCRGGNKKRPSALQVCLPRFISSLFYPIRFAFTIFPLPPLLCRSSLYGLSPHFRSHLVFFFPPPLLTMPLCHSWRLFRSSLGLFYGSNREVVERLSYRSAASSSGPVG